MGWKEGHSGEAVTSKAGAPPGGYQLMGFHWAGSGPLVEELVKRGLVPPTTLIFAFCLASGLGIPSSI